MRAAITGPAVVAVLQMPIANSLCFAGIFAEIKLKVLTNATPCTAPVSTTMTAGSTKEGRRRILDSWRRREDARAS